MELAPGPEPILTPPPTEETLSSCPYCACGFVQPRSWHELGDGRLRLKLRCPECQVLMMGNFDAALVARYDEQLVAGRHELCEGYERLLRENMSLEADVLQRVLAMDLIGPDDFIN